MKLSKKWLYAIVAASVTIVITIALALGLSLGLKKPTKIINQDKLALTITNNRQYIMGDQLDLSNYYITGQVNGETINTKVTQEMLVLPQNGVDHKSGLNKDAIFLQSGKKRIEIVAYNQSFYIDLEIINDEIIELLVPPENAVKLVENSDANDALQFLSVYAKTALGRTIKLSSEMVTIETITNLLGKEIINSDGKLFKTNLTDYSENIRIIISYRYQEGVNLPTSSYELNLIMPAELIDNNVKAIDVLWGDQTIYSSVASRTDLAEFIHNSDINLIYGNGQSQKAFFSDGKYLFEIVEYEAGKYGYAFVFGGEEPLAYSDNTKNSYKIKLGIDKADIYTPFGTDYSYNSADKMPSIGAKDTKKTTADNRKIFIPLENDNLVFFAEGKTYEHFSAVVEFEARTGETYVLETKTFNGNFKYSSEDIIERLNNGTIKEETNYRKATYYCIRDELKNTYYVSKETFSRITAGKDEVTIFYNNYGLSNQEIVTRNENNGFYYDQSGKLVQVANVTEIHAYYQDNDMFAFSLERAFTPDNDLQPTSTKKIVLGIGEEVSILEFNKGADGTVYNGLLVKISKGGEFLVSSGMNRVITENTVVEIATEDSGITYVGGLLDLDGMSFNLTLKNGDKLKLNADRTYKVYGGQERNWDESFFSMQRIDSLAGNGLFTFGNKYYANCSCSDAIISLTYVGSFRDSKTQANCTANYEFLTDTISVMPSFSPTYLVCGAQEQFLTNIFSKTINNANITLSSGRKFSYVQFTFNDEFSFDPNVLTIVVDKDLKNTVGTSSTLTTKWGIFEAGEKNVGVNVAWLRSGAIREDGTGYNNVYYNSFSEALDLSAAGDSFNLSSFNTNNFNLDENITVTEATTGEEKVLTLRQLLFNAISNYFKVGEYVATGSTTAIYFTVEENEMEQIDLVGAKFYTNSWVDIGQFIGGQLKVKMSSGKTIFSKTLDYEDLGKTLILTDSIFRAPENKQTKNINLTLNGLDASYKFACPITFFVRYDAPTHIDMNGSEAFISQDFLESAKGDASAAYYQQLNSQYESLKKYLNTSKELSAAFGRLQLALGFSINGKPLPVEWVNNAWALKIDDKYYYVEEDYIETTNDGDFARVVVNGSQIFVKLNPSYNGKDYIESDIATHKYLDFSPITFKLFTGTDMKGLVERGTYTLEEVAADAIFNVAYKNLDGSLYGGDACYVKMELGYFDGVNTISTNSENKQLFITLRIVDVPTIENANFINAAITENQLLSLGGDLTYQDKAQVAASDYTSFKNLPVITLEYYLAGEKHQVTLTEKEFLSGEFYAIKNTTPTVGETNYKTNKKAIKLLNGKKATLKFVFHGIEFGISVDLKQDYVNGMNARTLQMCANSNLFGGVLETIIKDLTFASGRPLTDIIGDKPGVGFNTSGEDYNDDFKLVLLVMQGNQLISIMDTANYDAAKIWGIDTFKTADIYNRVFTYKNYKENIKYYVSAQLIGTNLETLKNDLGENILDNLAVTELNLTEDYLEKVDATNIRTTYYARSTILGLVDNLSITGVKYTFASGLEYTVNNDNNLYLVVSNAGYKWQTAWDNDSEEHLLLSVNLNATDDNCDINVKLTELYVNGYRTNVSSYIPPVTGEKSMKMVFTSGGKNASCEFRATFVEVQILSFETDTELSFAEGAIISLADLKAKAGTIYANIVDLESGDTSKIRVNSSLLQLADITDEEEQTLGYKITLDGNAIKILNNSFKIKNVKWKKAS